MKMAQRITATGVILFVLASAAVTHASPGPTRMRLATLAPKGTLYHQILLAMGERWRQAPGGGVALTVYSDGTMGSEPDMVRRMRVGQIQAALLTVDGLSQIDDSVSALQKMPVAFRSLDEVGYVRGKLQPELERRLYDKGFVVLFWGDAGWVHFFSRQPAVLPEDFRKIKLLVTAGDNDQYEIMKASGYLPVSLEWTDALTSLQTGLIDGVPTPPFLALAAQYYTVANHMLDVKWVPLVGAVVITKSSWEALPLETRESLRASAVEAGEQMETRSRVEASEAIEAMKKRGLQVHTLSPAEEAEWRRVAEGVYPKVRGRLVPAEMFDRVQQLLAEYRAAPGKEKP